MFDKYANRAIKNIKKNRRKGFSMTKSMNKYANKYAAPIKVNDIKSYCNPDKGLAGYKVEVVFNGKNVPCPRHLDSQIIYQRADINGTNTVWYFFPFVGYGIINWGKLAAKHWANKMKKCIFMYKLQQNTK